MANFFKLSQFEEFQLWLDGLTAHHRHCGIPFGTQTAVLLNRNFKEDVRTSLQIVEDLIAITQRIVAAELVKTGEVDQRDLADSGKELRKQFRKFARQSRRIEGLVVFWDFLENYRTILLSVLRLAFVSRPEFRALSYLFTEQMLRFNRSEAAPHLKTKPYESPFQQLLQVDILKNITAQGSREQLEQLFIDFFALLCIAHYMRDEMRKHFPFHKLMSLFMHLNFSGRKFLKLLEESRKYLGQLYPEVAENLLEMSLALKMEMRRVFSGELRNLEAQKKIDVVYAQMQNGLGMMLNALQESFINLAHTLNPEFNEFCLFQELVRRQRESTTLLTGLNEVYRIVSARADNVLSDARFVEIRQTLERFRDTSMRFLYFKDWAAFEQFLDELDKAGPEDRVFVLHRLEVYVSTLIGEVQKRTILSKVVQDGPEETVEQGSWRPSL